MASSVDVKARAEGKFKRSQERIEQSANAWAEYQAQSRAVAEKTERLRALRLAKEAKEVADVVPEKAKTQSIRR